MKKFKAIARTVIQAVAALAAAAPLLASAPGADKVAGVATFVAVAGVITGIMHTEPTQKLLRYIGLDTRED